MVNILIVGAGGFGREVYGWMIANPNAIEYDQWQIAGFLDADPNALDGKKFPVTIVGDPLSYTFMEEDRLVCAVGDPITRLRLYRLMRERGGRFVTVRASNVIIGPGCRIDDGCILCPGVVITTNVTLMACTIVNVHSSVGHDAIIGEGCTLSGHVDITGGVRLGEGVFLGSHACVLPGKHVGSYAKVGAGSVVTRNVAPGATVFGVPAKAIIVPSKE